MASRGLGWALKPSVGVANYTEEQAFALLRVRMVRVAPPVPPIGASLGLPRLAPMYVTHLLALRLAQAGPSWRSRRLTARSCALT